MEADSKVILDKMKAQMCRDDADAEDEEEEEEDDERSDLITIETLLDLLDDMGTEEQVKSRQKMKLLNLCMRECLETSFGEVIAPIAVGHGWTSGRFPRISLTLVRSLCERIREALQDLENMEDQEEEPPVDGIDTNILESLSGVMREISEQREQVAGVAEQLMSVGDEIESLKGEASSDDSPDRLLSLMARHPGCAMSAHLVAVQKDFAKSITCPLPTPAKHPYPGFDGSNDNNVFTSHDPRGGLHAAKPSILDKIRQNFKQYLCIVVIVGVMNYRNLSRMVEMLSQDKFAKEQE
eukprot:TRINITY_DN5919_c1_g1_i1.p1 TRINITY_DN5919_c1_g1~~TRINITY_DN5919_c1_g1_i1.p1  ORF type:complete len:296 (+),score=66.31 TRINITY_DN5919_c1_g1_i1:76-963(+)